MLNMTVKQAKEGFLDRPKIVRAIGKANAAALVKAASGIRTVARRSMRRVKDPKNNAAPGQPPKARKGQLRDLLFFTLDSDAAAIAIGPVALGANPIVPGLHEFGGTQTIRNPRRRKRRIGGGGEVRLISNEPGRRGEGGKFLAQKRKAVEGRPGVRVIYTRLRTAAQVDRANRINAELYGPDTYSVTYPARPYMAPALDANRNKIPSAWENSVRSN